MVLGELGGLILGALPYMNNVTIDDEKVLMECLNEVSQALMSVDFQFKLISTMQSNIMKIVNLNELAWVSTNGKLFNRCVCLGFI